MHALHKISLKLFLHSYACGQVVIAVLRIVCVIILPTEISVAVHRKQHRVKRRLIIVGFC